jgi:hypothetical protein
MLGNQALEESVRPRIISRPTYVSSSSSLSTLSNLQAIESRGSVDDSASYISPPDTPFSRTHFAVPKSGKKGSADVEDARISPVHESTTDSSFSASIGDDAEAEITTSRQRSTAIDCGEDSISYGEYVVEFPPGISSPAPSLSRFYLRRSSLGEAVVLEIPSPQRAKIEVYQDESAPKVS